MSRLFLFNKNRAGAFIGSPCISKLKHWHCLLQPRAPAAAAANQQLPSNHSVRRRHVTCQPSRPYWTTWQWI